MIKYKNIKDIESLSYNLGTTHAFLIQIIDSPIIQYRVTKIPKRGGRGQRTLYLANDNLRSVQKNIRDDLDKRYECPGYVHGFVKGRSIVTNAKPHLQKRIVLNIDIKEYFESVSTEKVSQVFCSFGANEEIARLLATICTCNNCLVPGTVCAPVISNFVFAGCDKDLFDLAEKSQCTYSRYVDDMTFSGDATPSIKEIDGIIQLHGFSRNKEKTFRQIRGRRQYVTGLTVFDQTIPRIPKWKKDEFRKSIYFMEKHGIDGHLSRIESRETSASFVSRLDGLISFYRSIEPHFISNYEEKWEQIKMGF